MRLHMGMRIVGAVMVAGAAYTSAARAQVTVSGVGYVQYGYALKGDSSLVATTGSAGHNNNFDVSRSYVNVQTKSNNLATRVTVDVDGRRAAANQLTIRLKYAFLAWTPDSSHLTYKIGMIHTPWVDFEENLWDYRMQGPIALDRNGLMTSSDFGAGIDGSWKFDDINAQIGVYNGEGYSNAPGDPGKDLEARVSVRLLRTDLGTKSSGLRLTGYGQIGKANGGGTRQRLVGMVSYKSKAITLAGEIAMGQDSTGTGITAIPKQKSRLMSMFGVYTFPNGKAAVLARLDSYDPNTDSTLTAKNSATNTTVNKQTRIIGGVSYAVTPNLRLLLDADFNALQNGATNTFDKNRQMLFFHTEFRF